MYKLDYRSRYLYPRAQLGIEVPVELHLADLSVRLTAKIDTGATYCFFQREYAEALELNVEDGHYQLIKTVNGEFSAFGHTVEFTCIEHRTAAMVYFYADSQLKRNVLGRNGWLNQHRIGLVDHDLSLYLSHYNDAAT